MLPEAVAYAGIAGLAPQRAIFAAIAGCLAYCAIGQSRFAIVTPTSSSAAILAATFAAMPGQAGDKAFLVTVMVALVGVLFLTASALRLGNLAGFVSRPVLRGFAFGLAITIILRQLPTLTGISVPAKDIFHLTLWLLSAFPQWHLPSVLVGTAALGSSCPASRTFSTAPFSSLSPELQYRGCFIFPITAWRWWDRSDSAAVAVLLTWPMAGPRGSAALFTAACSHPVCQSWGTIRSLSLRQGDSVTANRELGALGVGNLASALVKACRSAPGFRRALPAKLPERGRGQRRSSQPLALSGSSSLPPIWWPGSLNRCWQRWSSPP